MPDMNKTGPLGTGPIGRGMGPCGGGMRGRGRGMGAGWWGRGAGWTRTSPVATAEEETTILTTQKGWFEDCLAEINQRLVELGQKKKD